MTRLHNDPSPYLLFLLPSGERVELGLGEGRLVGRGVLLLLLLAAVGRAEVVGAPLALPAAAAAPLGRRIVLRRGV